MKKLLAIFVCLMLVFSLCACDMLFPSDDNGNTNDTADKGFDTNNVTFLSAYAEAQELGFEGTLEEFIEVVSGQKIKLERCRNSKNFNNSRLSCCC